MGFMVDIVALLQDSLRTLRLNLQNSAFLSFDGVDAVGHATGLTSTLYFILLLLRHKCNLVGSKAEC
jgi:hypothetical protein